MHAKHIVVELVKSVEENGVSKTVKMVQKCLTESFLKFGLSSTRFLIK